MKKNNTIEFVENLVLACEIAKEKFSAFARGCQSAADEDRLLQTIQEIPVGLLVIVAGYTTDSIGNRKTIRCKMRKIEESKWIVEEHWFYESGAAITDKMARHSIVCVLSGKRPSILCSIPPTPKN